ncbi:hypothetical protein A3K48_00815 [candidate division WOR-1 bacterium RIFOXYA12_FULL_52_29]|uniref:Uncharacterized protein n=1 Tax=candidate division WOR-1 bacterium RIFOXYC12_FULL_54_18 TaxID=1802584 RepID=A0A1F4T432_UNCSA|nr:MAG: hypothetical protein A3K44_00815 [candidate division WOR-1 bacterium RIFOXYA2_FULL_51_19]OGC17134.1 MAG: hypothetical protein A3K48_00815 [candidate division WOR-1 bacterium RIFOXYA12_FULL_52_29]OGC25994.1 MAG: hypothetical protein A3K32_00810 [candidate division WOR-1 bacterium RIFOXYB2_FULL_45_9]OGC27551.1 MAG: hypothetical protein A3K49_00815 [candidate division WOR-1 bacterium RIFOXYC12_FULL_54_18]OGC29236.1 MAG: hypothetical protein A2346_00895 [candidate division WOR-1 bacterium R
MPALAVSEVIGTVCETKAIVDSPVSSTASITWWVTSPPKVCNWVNVGKDPDINVNWQSKDDSRTTGYPCAVSFGVEAYNFSSWSWIPGGGGNSIKGSNTRTGKYNNYGTWRIPLNQPMPVTKYKYNAMADTKGKPTRNESRELYVVRIQPVGVRSTNVRNAAPAWIIGRYERALMLRSLANEYTKMKNPSSSVDFDQEMAKLIVSCGALFGPTSPSDYAQDAGLGALELASNTFGNLATSGLLTGVGAVAQAYSWGTWAKNTLTGAADQLKNQFNAWHVKNAFTYDLAPSLNNLADAMRDEANEMQRLVWTAPNDTNTVPWKNLLQTELDRVNSAYTSLSSTYTAANLYFSSLGPLPSVAAANKDTVYKYLDSVRDFLRSERAILQMALTGTFTNP